MHTYIKTSNMIQWFREQKKQKFEMKQNEKPEHETRKVFQTNMLFLIAKCNDLVSVPEESEVHRV